MPPGGSAWLELLPGDAEVYECCPECAELQVFPTPIREDRQPARGGAMQLPVGAAASPPAALRSRAAGLPTAREMLHRQIKLRGEEQAIDTDKALGLA